MSPNREGRHRISVNTATALPCPTMRTVQFSGKSLPLSSMLYRSAAGGASPFFEFFSSAVFSCSRYRRTNYKTSASSTLPSPSHRLTDHCVALFYLSCGTVGCFIRGRSERWEWGLRAELALAARVGEAPQPAGDAGLAEENRSRGERRLQHASGSSIAVLSVVVLAVVVVLVATAQCHGAYSLSQ